MRLPKRYGQSQIAKCPFCGQQALAKNHQKIPVCLKHKEKELPPMKCACGSYLDLVQGKYGPFYNCFKCGTINMKKALELNPVA